MSIRWYALNIASTDPARLGRWWAEVLGLRILGEDENDVMVGRSEQDLPILYFHRSPDQKVGTNRLHLDLSPTDRDAEVERLLDMGARHVDIGQGERSWVVLADPEGNEFCVLRSFPTDSGSWPKGSVAMRPDTRTVFRSAVVAGLGVLAVALAALAVYAVRGILVLAIVALFVAVSLDPAVRWLTRYQVRRPLAVGIILVLTLIIVGGLVWAVVPPLIRQAARLSSDLPVYIASFTEKSRALRELGDRYGVTQSLQDLAKDLPGKIGSSVVGFLRTLFGAIFSGLTVIVLTIYFMVDLPRLRAGVVRLFPPGNRPHVRRMVDVTVDKVGSYMIGNVTISLFAGIASFIALTALGASFALPLAVVVAITDLIPMIGATLGAAVCVVVALIADSIWPTAVLVAVFFIVYQQVENYLIAPRVLRNAVDISAVAVLIAGLIGAAVLGLIGALMAIPIAAVIKVLISPKLDEMDARETLTVRDAPPG